MIFYSRCDFSADGGGAIHCFDLVYPQQVVTRISRSLRPPEGLANKTHALSVE
jgi:hypothetical protein